MVDTNNKKKVDFLVITVLLLVLAYYRINFRIMRFSWDGIIRFVLLAECFVVYLGYVRARISRLHPIIVCFMIGTFPSCIVGIEKTTAVSYYVLFIVVSSCLYYLTFYIQEYGYELQLISVVSIICAIVTIASLFCHMQGIDIEDMGRGTGVTTNANTMGIYAYISLIFFLYHAFNGNFIKKIIFYLLALLACWEILFSGSRAASIVMILYLGMYVFLLVRKAKIEVILPYITLMAIFLVFLKHEVLYYYLKTKFMRLGDDGFGRFEIWRNGIKIWSDHKLFGCGLNCGHLLNEGKDIWSYRLHFHNSYIELLVDTGLLGIAFVGIGLGYYLFKLVSPFFSELKKGFTSWLLWLCVLGGLFISTLTEAVLFSAGSTECFMFWFAFFMCVYRLQKI